MNLPKFKSLEEYLGTQPQKPHKPEKHKKGWGYELWIANTPLYCGKVLVLYKDKRCSLHFHVSKDETFYIAKGRIILETIYRDGSKEVHIMSERDCFHVTPGLMHSFVGADTESHIVEFSTQHFEEDSYRVRKGD